MATDATGTPTTNFAFPTYNTASDIPSGKGFDAAITDVDSKLAASTTLLGAVARSIVRKAGTLVGTRRAINFIEGSGVTITTADNAGTEAVDITIAGAVSGATVGTTIGGLGSTADGKVGLLRLGSSPYNFLGLVYDATYTKWVSQPFEIGITNFASNGTTASADFTALLTTIARKEFIDAGLTFQVRFTGAIACSGGGNTSGIKLKAVEYTDGDTAAGTNATATLLSLGNYTTQTWKDTGWVTGPVPATPETMSELTLQLSTAGGGASNVALTGKLIGRWVA